MCLAGLSSRLIIIHLFPNSPRVSGAWRIGARGGFSVRSSSGGGGSDVIDGGVRGGLSRAMIMEDHAGQAAYVQELDVVCSSWLYLPRYTVYAIATGAAGTICRFLMH